MWQAYGLTYIVQLSALQLDLQTAKANKDPILDSQLEVDAIKGRKENVGIKQRGLTDIYVGYVIGKKAYFELMIYLPQKYQEKVPSR